MIKQLRKRGAIGLLLLSVATLFFLLPSTALALEPGPTNEPTGTPGGTRSSFDICGDSTDCNSFVETYVNPIILFLSLTIGIGAVISFTISGIQYSRSADDPAVVSAAKQRIFNTVLGLLAYAFLYALINYLVPGGVF
jgi:hypothetical protein